MNKIWMALALIMVLMSKPAAAQTEFRWGVKGGLNFTTYDSDADDVQARMGQWGALCRWKFNDAFAIQPELFYARMGIRSLQTMVQQRDYTPAYATLDGQNYEWFMLQLLTDNVQLPILFKYYLPIEQFSRGINVFAGPLMSQRFDYKVSTPSQRGYLRDSRLGQPLSLIDIARAQNKFTVHAVWGLGYDSPSGIGVDFRYQMGITPIWDKDKVGCLNQHSHDRVMSLSFSYTF